jgi:DNA polymerase
MSDSPPRLTRSQFQCLDAMGIEPWVRRDSPPPQPQLSSPTPAAPPKAESDAGAPASTVPGGDIAALDWDGLERAVRACTRCPLHESRTQGVPGVGDRQARLLIVGEAPGADEDRRGEPFVGRAGQLLDRMLKAIGLDRGQVYITNVLKSRPPGNRDPRPDEVAACEPYLRRQIELMQPQLIVALGRIAAQYLLRSERPLGRLRGAWHEYGPRATPLLVTYHPAYLLRNPAGKRQAWEDLKRVRDRLREPPP